MDAWTDLLNCLADPLHSEEDLALALENAVDAEATCPKASAATLKGNLVSIVELTSAPHILDLASRLKERLGRTSKARAGRASERQSAQDADSDDSGVAWWQGFVPAVVDQLSPRSRASEIVTAAPLPPDVHGNIEPEKDSADESGLETFAARQTQRAADSDLETFAPVATQNRTASRTWTPGND